MVSRLRLTVLAIAASVGADLVSLSAVAAPSAAEKETARGLMAEGRAARARGDTTGAVRAFAGADALMHVPTTGLELARSQAAAGLLVEARDTALRVARLPASPDDPLPFEPAREAAAALASELEARIPSVRVAVKNVPAGLAPRVQVDDLETPEELLEQAIRVDPGHHVVVAEAGMARVVEELDIAERASRDVTLVLPLHEAPARQAVSAYAVPVVSGSAGLSPGAATKFSPTTSHDSPLLVVAGFSAAGAGALVGVVAGLVSLAKTDGVKSSGRCQNGASGPLCNPSEDGEIGAARTMATVSDVSLVLASAGTVVGVLGLFVGGSRPSPSSVRPRLRPAEPESSAGGLEVTPWIGPGSVGLSGAF
jgi:hypothetical protein